MGSASGNPAGTAQERLLLAPLIAPRLARGVVAVVFFCFVLVAYIRIIYSPDGALHLTVAAACLLTLFGLQTFFFTRPRAVVASRTGYAALALQAALVYIPLIEFKQNWVGQPGFLAGSALLVLPPVLAWSSFGAVVASVAAIQYSLTDTLDAFYGGVSTVITGLVVYGLTRLSTLVVDLHAARNDLARLAVAQERLRFARDLHDLLGYSLSAITLKSELTRRLVLVNPAKAEEELSEVLDISRRALADVRTVASGYRELSLEAEAESARSVLADAEVDVAMTLDYGDLPTRVRTVLATVLREGITNVLRHSKAERCEITIRRVGTTVQLDIVNDGAQERNEPSSEHGGSGIPNLVTRVSALSGTLVAGREDDDHFRLHASVPADPPRQQPSDTEPV